MLRIQWQLPVISTTLRVSNRGSIISRDIDVSLLFCKFIVSNELRFSNIMAGRTLMLKKICLMVLIKIEIGIKIEKYLHILLQI